MPSFRLHRIRPYIRVDGYAWKRAPSSRLAAPFGILVRMTEVAGKPEVELRSSDGGDLIRQHGVPGSRFSSLFSVVADARSNWMIAVNVKGMPTALPRRGYRRSDVLSAVRAAFAFFCFDLAQVVSAFDARTSD